MSALLLILAAYLQALSVSGWASGWAAGLQCLSLSVLMSFALKSRNLKSLALGTWLFTATWLLLSVEWIHISLSRYGGMPAPMAWLAVLLLSGGLAMYHALAICMAKRITHQASWMGQALSLACAWTLAELARATWFTGFPWGSPGYAHTDGLLKITAPYVGVMGISALSAGLAALMAVSRLRANASWSYQALTHLLLPLGLAWSPALTSLGSSDLAQTVTLLQANVDPIKKFQDGGKEEAQWYLQQMQTSSADLILAPETALAQISSREAFKDTLAQSGIPKLPHQAVIIGTMEQKGDDYANAAWGWMGGQVLAYHKQHLVPFGEFTPPALSWINQWLNIPYSNFTEGQGTRNPFVHRQHVYALGICYEDLFGEEMAKLFQAKASHPTALVNISNLAWFGDGKALDQHLIIGRMRALELRRPMLMATNTGWSAVIDDTGQVTGRLPKSQRASMTLDYRGVDEPPTLYAQWAGRWGHMPLWILAAVGLFLSGLLFARPKIPSPE